MKAVVLLSGGLDSTVLLAQTCAQLGSENVTALNLYYGQRHNREIISARKVAEYYNVKLIERQIDVYEHSDSTMLNGRGDVPEGTYSEQGCVPSTYVPFRNGLMLSIAAAYAYSLGAQYIAYGAHMDDNRCAYPDCSLDFVEAMNNAIKQGTANEICISAPFVTKSKADIVRLGLSLCVPFEYTWSCYNGGDKPCRECATCIDREKAFEANGLVDPLLQ